MTLFVVRLASVHKPEALRAYLFSIDPLELCGSPMVCVRQQTLGEGTFAYRRFTTSDHIRLRITSGLCNHQHLVYSRPISRAIFVF